MADEVAKSLWSRKERWNTRHDTVHAIGRLLSGRAARINKNKCSSTSRSVAVRLSCRVVGVSLVLVYRTTLCQNAATGTVFPSLPPREQESVIFYRGRKLCFDRVDARHEDCCHEVYGETGNAECWDSRYPSAEVCCYQSKDWEKKQQLSCTGESATYCLHLLQLSEVHSKMRFRGCLAEADRKNLNGVNPIPIDVFMSDSTTSGDGTRTSNNSSTFVVPSSSASIGAEDGAGGSSKARLEQAKTDVEDAQQQHHFPFSSSNHVSNPRRNLWLLARFFCHKVSDYLSNAALFVGQTLVAKQEELLKLEGVDVSSSSTTGIEKDNPQTFFHLKSDFHSQVGVWYEKIKRILLEVDDDRAEEGGGLHHLAEELEAEIVVKGTASSTHNRKKKVLKLLTKQDLSTTMDKELMLLEPIGGLAAGIPETHLYLEFFDLYGKQHRKSVVELEKVNRQIVNAEKSLSDHGEQTFSNLTSSRTAELQQGALTVEDLVSLREKRDELLLSTDLQLQQLAQFFKQAMHRTTLFMQKVADLFYTRLKPHLTTGCEEDVCNDGIVEENARRIDSMQHLVSIRYGEEGSPAGTTPIMSTPRTSEELTTTLASLLEVEATPPANEGDELEPSVSNKLHPFNNVQHSLPEPEVADLVFAQKLSTVRPNCPALARSPGVLDFSPILWPPVDFVPLVFEKEYTINGRAVIHTPPVYFAQKSFEKGWNERHDFRWEREHIEKEVSVRAEDVETGIYTSYGDTALHRDFFQKHRDLIEDKHVLVLGSEIPWIEVFLLRMNARKVTTVDYREPKVVRRHPKLRFLHFLDLGKKFGFFQRKELHGESDDEEIRANHAEPPDQDQQDQEDAAFHELFDLAFTYSSLEHAGLGRYGDQLNPFADVQTASLIFCVLKPNAYFFTGPNTIDTNQWLVAGSQDRLYWNSGRDLMDGFSNVVTLSFNCCIDFLSCKINYLFKPPDKDNQAASHDDKFPKG
ncbi:unnamed protein product [Amoebophrya sp. A120]|nr:unnamed protein product [Amoebophrya sp. A120]|eukprot:GSA120T00006985001.1